MESRVLFINSKDRSTGSLNSFTIDTTGLTDSFWNVGEDEQLYVHPQSLAVLNDFENINEYNRILKYKIVDVNTQAETDYEIALDKGVYTSFTLQAEVQGKLNFSFQTNALPFTVTVNYDDDTIGYGFTFTSTNPTYFDDNELRFNFTSVETSPAQLLGFDEGIITPDSRATTTQVINSAQALDMVFQPSIQVHCSIVTNNYETEGGLTKATDMLFEVSQGAKNDFIIFENPGDTYRSQSQDQFGSIAIRYTDNLGRPILFQSNSRLTLAFTKFKKQSDKNEITMIKLLEKILDTNKLSVLSDYLRQNK